MRSGNTFWCRSTSSEYLDQGRISWERDEHIAGTPLVVGHLYVTVLTLDGAGTWVTYFI